MARIRSLSLNLVWVKPRQFRRVVEAESRTRTEAAPNTEQENSCNKLQKNVVGFTHFSEGRRATLAQVVSWSPVVLSRFNSWLRSIPNNFPIWILEPMLLPENDGNVEQAPFFVKLASTIRKSSILQRRLANFFSGGPRGCLRFGRTVDIEWKVHPIRKRNCGYFGASVHWMEIRLKWSRAVRSAHG